MKPKYSLFILAGALIAAAYFTTPGNFPVISDPLTTAVVSAYAEETGTDKAQEAAALAKVYARGQEFAKSPQVVKAVDLFKELKAEANDSLTPEALPKVRAVIATELNSKLPIKADATFDRSEAAKQFKRCQTALEACK